MADDPPLLRLPEITMNHILYFCDYLEISQLRKVCHSLRNHIDANKPDAHVKEVRLGIWMNAEIFFESENNIRIWIDYKEAEGGCTVECTTYTGSRSLKTISGLDPMDAFIQDVKIYFRHLKTPLRQFQLGQICFDALLQIKREQPQESRIFPLKVSKLELYGLSADQILATLPLFDANHLKDLKIETDINAVPDGDGLNDGAEDGNVFHALFETEHWRNVEKVNIYPTFKISNVRQIFHLKKFHGFISRMTAADVKFLKNKFITSPLFEHSLIKVDEDLDLLSIKDTFGAPSVEIEDANWWYFHIPNDTARVLLVEVTCKETVDIIRIDRSEVLPGAVIIY
ncbi:hypothetical protein CRE_23443 [Caenorhabditis remanei]|uniref:F-box domain-containing protein n=1 Tax=Caenorhabditis remanei TaxID=31234 RepID=E3MGS5_CAERE|nr:hypothetical protein CRE_23443 [Caenorhabditis remanei]